MRKNIWNYQNSNPDYVIEVWLLFLCDSLAKTDITIYGKDDEELTSKFAWIAEKLYKKKTPSGAYQYSHTETSQHYPSQKIFRIYFMIAISHSEFPSSFLSSVQ